MVFISCSLCARAQQRTVSLSHDSATIGAIVTDLENQTGLHFYYDTADFDSLHISIVTRNRSLNEALDQIFRNSEFHYVILDDQYVLLTRDAVIKTRFNAPDYPSAVAAAKSEASGFTRKPKVKPEAGIENKLFQIGIPNKGKSKREATLVGYVRSSKTGEPVAGAMIKVEKTGMTVNADPYGYYQLTVPSGHLIIQIQSFGMMDTRRQIMLNGDGKLNIDMIDAVTSLKEVIISAAKMANTRRVYMGEEHLNISTINQMPSTFGEADVLRALTTLPGVKTVGEAGTGFNVRGGATDQNLILFNNATIFNPSHFFGFFSAFNPDVIKEVVLYKSSLPAKYGGRLSSVLDISSRDGNKKHFAGSAGIGPLTSRLNIEGPIIKDKLSFIAGARTTYSNWLMDILPEEYKHSRASFSDINFHLSYQMNSKNNFYLTGYYSKDDFRLNSDTSYSYENRNVSFKWKHSFNNKFRSELIAGYDNYQYTTGSTNIPMAAYRLTFDVAQLTGRADFTWFWNPKHTAEFGVTAIRYKLRPGQYDPASLESLVTPDTVARENGLETALYLSDKWNISRDFTIDGGIRYAMYSFLGPGTVNEYAPSLPKNPDNLLGTSNYSAGKFIKTYSAPEYRLALRYSFTNDLSIKAGLTSTHQYIHLLSNTAAISPTDIWKLSDPNIAPQYGQQASFGVYKNLKYNTIETSLEVYYKKIQNYLDYVSGANLVMNHHIETDVVPTKGKAYGIEFMIRKSLGRMNGWLSYTYSRVLLKQDDSLAGEVVNQGRYYSASYDKPHEVTLVFNYKFLHRLSLSVNSTYSTGRPITVPIGRITYNNSQRTIFGDRNSYRIPDYFRTDLSINLDGNYKVHQKIHASWTFGAYNLTGRKNPYSVYYVTEDGIINGYRLSIFGSIIPFVNFNLRF